MSAHPVTPRGRKKKQRMWGHLGIIASFLSEGVRLLKGSAGIFQQDINQDLKKQKNPKTIPVIFLQQ